MTSRSLCRLDTDSPVSPGDLLPDYRGGTVKFLRATDNGNLVAVVLPRTAQAYKDVFCPALCGCYWREDAP
jgi:hypothetical protein